MLHLDFETRSRVDLIKAGGHRYAADPSTEVLMMSYAFDDGPAELWLPSKRCPKEVNDHIYADGQVAAFNAGFERLIFEYVLGNDFDVLVPPLEQYYCVAAQARANNLPGNLDDCSRMLGASHRKDAAGKALIKLFCIPNADGTFNDSQTHPEEWAQFCSYCVDDTEAERDVSHMMRPLTENELEDWRVCELINNQGLMIDRELAAAAVRYADAEQRELVARIRELTGDSPSGLVFRRLAGHLGRSDNMVKLRGINLYPTGIGALIEERATGFTGEYICRVTRTDGREEMTVLIEVAAPDDGLKPALVDHLRSRLGVEVGVELAGPGDLATLTEIETRQKPIRLLDLRKDA